MSDALTLRHFVSYSGVKLPLNLHTPLDDVRNRITFYRAHYNSAEQMVKVEKMVYGEVESTHDYQYHADGSLSEALITLHAEDEQTRMCFAPDGELLSSETEAL